MTHFFAQIRTFTFEKWKISGKIEYLGTENYEELKIDRINRVKVPEFTLSK